MNIAVRNWNKRVNNWNKPVTNLNIQVNKLGYIQVSYLKVKLRVYLLLAINYLNNMLISGDFLQDHLLIFNLYYSAVTNRYNAMIGIQTSLDFDDFSAVSLAKPT